MRLDKSHLSVLAIAQFETKMHAVRHAYVDICEDLVAGTLLGQILYWFTPDKETGKMKVRVYKEGRFWLAKRQEDWFNEIRITEKQYRTAVKKLEQRGFIEKKTFKFGNNPTTHITPVWEKIDHALQEWMDAAKKEVDEKLEEEVSLLTKGQKTVKSSTSEQLKPETPQKDWLLTKGQKGNLPKVNNDIDQRSKTITEITNRDYKQENTKQQQQDFSQIKKDVVVEVTMLFENIFHQKIEHASARRIAGESLKRGIEIEEALLLVQKAEQMELTRGKQVKNLVGLALKVISGEWDFALYSSSEAAATRESSRSTKVKPMPEAVRLQLEEHSASTELSEEEFQQWRETIQSKIKKREMDHKKEKQAVGSF